MNSVGGITDLQLHLFKLKGNAITHLQRVEAAEGLGPLEQLFSPRISPDGKKAIVLHDLGEGGKGTLDDVLIVDLDRDVAAVTERIPQVADGLESLAFHPSGRFAVVCCLEGGLDATTVSHLAVIDLTSHPARLLSYTPIELIPEGIEFTADGSRLFVGSTAAQHLAVFDVEGSTLKRLRKADRISNQPGEEHRPSVGDCRPVRSREARRGRIEENHEFVAGEGHRRNHAFHSSLGPTLRGYLPRFPQTSPQHPIV
jgi:hypothetical protein